MPTKAFSCSPDEFTKLRLQLAQAGVALPPGNSGEFSPPGHSEITLSFSYNGTDTLILTIQHEAWYETAGEIWAGLEPYLNGHN